MSKSSSNEPDLNDVIRRGSEIIALRTDLLNKLLAGADYEPVKAKMDDLYLEWQALAAPAIKHNRRPS